MAGGRLPAHSAGKPLSGAAATLDTPASPAAPTDPTSPTTLIAPDASKSPNALAARTLSNALTGVAIPTTPIAPSAPLTAIPPPTTLSPPVVPAAGRSPTAGGVTLRVALRAASCTAMAQAHLAV